MPAVSRKAVGVVAALAGVAVGVGIGAYRWGGGPPPEKPELATVPTTEETWSGGILAGTLRDVREEKVALAAGRHQVRALVRMRTERPARLGRPAGWEEFERFKEDQTLAVRSKGFLAAVAAHADVARLPLVAPADDKAVVIDAMLAVRWETPEILAVALNGDDTVQLNVILTALVDFYLRRTSEAEEKEAARYRAERDDRLRVIGGKIEELRAALAKLPGGQPAGTNIERLILGQQLASAKSDANKHRERKAELESHLKQLDAEEAGEPVVTADLLDATLAAVPAVAARQREADEASKTLTDLKTKLAVGSPLLADAERKLREATDAVTAARTAAKPDLLRKLKAERKEILPLERRTLAAQIKIADGQLAAAEKDVRKAEDALAQLGAADGVRPREKDELDALLEQREALVREQVRGELPGDREPRVTLKEPPQTLLDHNVRTRSTLTIATAGKNGSVRDVRVVLKAGARVFIGEKRAELREVATGSPVEASLALRTSADGPPEAYELRVIENR